MDLRKIQEWMQGTLLNPYGEEAEKTEDIVCSSDRLKAQQHLAIYQRSYVARLRECMAKQFEGLEYALGEKLFQQFADQYLQTYPSKSYTLHDLGKNFSRFLEETRPDRDLEEKEDWPDFLIELALFEYHIQVVFDEENTQKYERAKLTLPEESLQLVTVLQLFEFQFPVNYYFQSFKRGEAPELPYKQASWCVIYRNNYRVAILGLSYWQFKFLSHFKTNGNIQTALESVAAACGKPIDEVISFWKQWKARWIKEGLLCRYV